MPVLGMKGTGGFATPDERPKNYRELILLLFPNASAPLTALLSKLKNEPTDDPEFKIFLKALPNQRVLQSGGATSGSTSILLTAAASIIKAGHSLMNERTGEVLWVTANPSPYTTLTVVRGKGTAASAMLDQDGLWIIGSHYQEGAPLPQAVAYDPTVVNNWCQIFRNVLDATNTAKMTHLRTGDNLKEAKRECLELHAMEMEKAFLFGAGVEDTSGSQPERTTKGLNTVLTSNVTDFAGSVSIDGWDNFLEGVFTSGSNEKLLLCGAKALNVLNKLARIHHTIEVTPTEQTYGVMMQTWLTPYGTLQIKQHPLLTNNAAGGFNSWGFIIDPNRIVYRFLRGRDTQYLENRQSPGDDATRNEFLTEAGLEFQFEQAHAIFKRASAAAA